VLFDSSLHRFLKGSQAARPFNFVMAALLVASITPIPIK
jgi:hypothetical protein